MCILALVFAFVKGVLIKKVKKFDKKVKKFDKKSEKVKHFFRMLLNNCPVLWYSAFRSVLAFLKTVPAGRLNTVLFADAAATSASVFDDNSSVI